jgi:hypothetical protein
MKTTKPFSKIFVTVLTNCDDWTTHPTHVGIEVTLQFLLRLYWDMLTYAIASMLNKNLHQYETFMMNYMVFWLDAKCGCSNTPDGELCNCDEETLLGIMTIEELDSRYEENSDEGNHMETPHLVVTRWGGFRLKVWREYCPSQYDSYEFDFKEIAIPFLKEWCSHWRASWAR